jgi:hypothetical protein
MATRTVSNAGGNWNAVGTWTGGVVPIAGDDIAFTITSGNLTVNVASANLVGVNFTNYIGTITFNANITTNGVLNLGAGLYTQAGASGIVLNGTATLTSGGVTWSRTLVFGGTSATYTLVGNWTVTGLITFQGSGTTTLTNNTLNINGSLTQTTAGIYAGTTSIIFGGTGTWSNSSTGIINNVLTINTVGTLTISGTVYKGSGLFTYTSGIIDDTTGTVSVQALTLNLSGFTFRKLLVNGAITLTSNLNATTFGTWGNSATTFTLGAFSLNFTNLELGNTNTTTLPTNWTAQNVELVNITTSTLTGNSITITENLTQSGAGLYSGTTTFTYSVPALATGTWSRTGNGRLQNNLNINSAGTINFTGGHIGGGIFTYTAGTVNVQVGSILYNSSGSTTFNGAGITWYNVVFGAVSGTASVGAVTLNTQLICLGTLTLQLSTTTFSGTDGTFDTYDFVLGSDGTALRTTQLVSTKTYRVRQSFTCTQATSVGQILLRSTIGGSQAIFTLDSGSTIDVGFVNATDINSSLGRPIYSYKGVFSNTLNWGLLPTDNTRSGRSTFVG